MNNELKRNFDLYDKYAINGWPCHFLTAKAMDKYNSKIAKWCNKLPEGTMEFNEHYKSKRTLYIVVLNIYDVILFKLQKK